MVVTHTEGKPGSEMIPGIGMVSRQTQTSLGGLGLSEDCACSTDLYHEVELEKECFIIGSEIPSLEGDNEHERQAVTQLMGDEERCIQRRRHKPFLPELCLAEWGEDIRSTAGPLGEPPVWEWHCTGSLLLYREWVYGNLER